MSRDIVLFLFGAALSGLFSWLFTYVYYRKSLRQQEVTAASEIATLADALAAHNKADAAFLWQKRIEDCVAEYRRAGTPVRVIDTYSDLSADEKADLLDTVMLRVKGRKAKSNKYRARR